MQIPQNGPFTFDGHVVTNVAAVSAAVMGRFGSLHCLPSSKMAHLKGKYRRAILAGPHSLEVKTSFYSDSEFRKISLSVVALTHHDILIMKLE